jgi:dehydrogenase/reductase SDR family protein 12
MRSRVADATDALLEFPVVPSFTSIGPAIRSRLDGWTPLSAYDMSGRVVVLTGPTSGLGLAAAHTLAELGASLVLVGRDRVRTETVRDNLARAEGTAAHSVVVADMSDLDQVQAAATVIRAERDAIDVLIHNAGALTAERRLAPNGMEATVAAQVVGPFLLTSLLLHSLRAARPGRVVTVSSGGMYASGLTVENLQMGESDYGGAEQYARAKRAQVTLNEMWAERWGGSDVVFHSAHPGWADTPGVRTSLPSFRRLTAPLLRSAQAGADTVVWLSADDRAPLESNGHFWHDRRPRSLHRLAATRRSDTPRRRDDLWNWVSAAAAQHQDEVV